MPIVKIDALDGGVNELANAETLRDSQLQASQNYEILGDDKLTLRKEPEEYGDHVSGDSLKTVLDAIFSSSILQISPPLYPVKRIVDGTGTRIMDGEFVMLVFGLAGTDYKLYLCYENTSNSWTATQVDITGITYTSDTYLEFFVGDDKMIITDTFNETTNFPHYVKIDADGELITGLFSIKSPTNKATMEPVVEYDSSEFEEDVDDVHLDDCGLVQCVYTVITKDGDESNPSPISDTRMMQFFKKDLTDKNDIRWIDNFQITNLSVPVLTGDLTEELKYFNVYFRVIRYSEGEAAEPFYFSQRFEIVDKENNTGDTGNGYLITVPQDESLLLSYENDIAPFAKHAAETSGIVGFANIREKIRFPFNFEKYCPILINNVNNKNFVDAIVGIRLYDADNVGTLDANEAQVDFIDDLDLTYYKSIAGNFIDKPHLLRIYDEDLTTPIRVNYFKYDGGTYIDIWVSIPLIIAGQLKTIYLCFNTPTGTELGVTDVERQSYEYGRFSSFDSFDGVPDMFTSERVKSNKTIICSPLDFLKSNGEVINLADDNNNGEALGTEGSFSELGTKQLLAKSDIGTGSYLLKGDADGDDFSQIKYDELSFETIPERFTMWGRIAYTNLDACRGRVIFLFEGESEPKGLYLTVREGGLVQGWHWALQFSSDIGKGSQISDNPPYIIFDGITIDDITTGNVFVCASMSKDENVSIFVGNLNTGSFSAQTLDWDSWIHPDEMEDELFQEIGSISIGFNDYASDNLPLDLELRICQFQLTINKFYNANNLEDKTAVYNIASFMPSFETQLGLKLKE